MQSREKKAFEPSGLVPRSIVRTFDRFRQQLLPGSETAAIREYRISRYQVLVSTRCLFTLLTIPIVTNWLVSSWILSPLIEHFWNTQQNEIFLNSYQEERAFSELESFLEKLFFESLLTNNHTNTLDSFSLVDTLQLQENKAINASKRNNVKQIFENSASFRISIPYSTNTSQERYSYDALPLDLHFSPAKIKQGLGSRSLAPTFFCIEDAEDRESKTQCCARACKALQSSTRENNSSLLPLMQPGETEIFPLFSLPAKKAKNEYFPSLLTIVEATEEIMPQKRAKFLDFNGNLQNRGFLESEIDSVKLKERVQKKILELAFYYNQQTISSITNVVGDVVSIFTLGCLFVWMRPEISILKSFLIEAIYSLSDTTKSFLLILLTDLLVGFHSPRGWETALELLLKHFGLPENQDFVFLFVATFPVLLDTVFKYWIFRHLNKISPSTVATYHSMIE